MPEKLFITGAAGYIGAMLCDQFSRLDSVSEIIALDKEPMPDMLQGNKKITYIEMNTVDQAWAEKVSWRKPTIIIHTAWQIRELYGKRDLEWKWNIDGSNRVFDFAFTTPSVKKLIHFSSVAPYGAFPENSIDHLFTEEETFRQSEYLYAEEKRACEEQLKSRFFMRKASGAVPQVLIVRPAAITGPRGRFGRIRFGLQSALSGQLKGNPAYDLISTIVSVVPITEKWCRQYVHEDDVTDVVYYLAFGAISGEYEIFNLCPPGEVVRGEDMARAVGKKSVMVPPSLVRIAFFFMWHLTQGTIPTAPGSWRSYSYPIAVDGSKVTKILGHQYKWGSFDAFTKREGRYK